MQANAKGAVLGEADHLDAADLGAAALHLPGEDALDDGPEGRSFDGGGREPGDGQADEHGQAKRNRAKRQQCSPDSGLAHQGPPPRYDATGRWPFEASISGANKAQAGDLP